MSSFYDSIVSSSTKYTLSTSFLEIDRQDHCHKFQFFSEIFCKGRTEELVYNSLVYNSLKIRVSQCVKH